MHLIFWIKTFPSITTKVPKRVILPLRIKTNQGQHPPSSPLEGNSSALIFNSHSLWKYQFESLRVECLCKDCTSKRLTVSSFPTISWSLVGLYFSTLKANKSTAYRLSRKAKVGNIWLDVMVYGLSATKPLKNDRDKKFPVRQPSSVNKHFIMPPSMNLFLLESCEKVLAKRITGKYWAGQLFWNSSDKSNMIVSVRP